MKKLPILFAFALMLTLVHCESEPVTGGEDVIVLESMQLTVDTTYVFGDSFRAEGKVTNTGNETITPIWYVEGAFFTSGSSSVKMGGANDWFNFSLAPGQTAEWFLRFQDTQYPASEHSNFSIGDLRAYKDNQGVEN
ncbi:MAG: hypothetical protein JJ971_12260 [Balneolaceae bacterium]|nr:hypothetical protein [Balneolaceae bacterium]MBO6547375.1 hypothetical protein [Balneolaceae bacterium]MBO6647678.1 hypothetical protein [Balneolaceae bacterium]